MATLKQRMSKRSIGHKQVASEAKVSMPTVSRYLAGLKTRTDREIKAAILRLIERHDAAQAPPRG